MWRAKEKLRNTDIVVTEDSQQRLLELMKKEVEKIKKDGLKSPTKEPASPKKGPDSPKKVLDSPKKVPISPRKSRTRGNSPVKTPSSPMRKMPSLLDMLELPGKIVNKQLIQCPKCKQSHFFQILQIQVIIDNQEGHQDEIFY